VLQAEVKESVQKAKGQIGNPNLTKPTWRGLNPLSLITAEGKRKRYGEQGTMLDFGQRRGKNCKKRELIPLGVPPFPSGRGKKRSKKGGGEKAAQYRQGGKPCLPFRLQEKKDSKDKGA